MKEKNLKMKNKIVFVADIADDIDDLIAIEYLAVNGYLRCLVLDGKSRSDEREKALVDMGVEIVNDIPEDTDIIFCGGALTKLLISLKTIRLSYWLLMAGSLEQTLFI